MIGNIIDFFKSAQAPDGKTVWLAIGIFAGAWLLALLLGMLATISTQDLNRFEKSYVQDTFAGHGNGIFFYGIVYVIVLLLWKLIPIVAHILVWGLSIKFLFAFILSIFSAIIDFVRCCYPQVNIQVKIGTFLLALNRLLVSAAIPLCTYIVYFVK